MNTDELLDTLADRLSNDRACCESFISKSHSKPSLLVKGVLDFLSAVDKPGDTEVPGRVTGCHVLVTHPTSSVFFFLHSQDYQLC